MSMNPAVHVSIRFIGHAVDPEQITRLLSVRPSMAHAKGDPVAKHPERRRPTGIWCLESPLDDTQPVETHIQYLLDAIEPGRAGLPELARMGFLPDLYCSVFSEDAERSEALISITSDTLARMAALGLSVSMCFYGYRSE